MCLAAIFGYLPHAERRSWPADIPLGRYCVTTFWKGSHLSYRVSRRRLSKMQASVEELKRMVQPCRTRRGRAVATQKRSAPW